MKSLIQQYRHGQDGTIAIEGQPLVKVELAAHQAQAAAMAARLDRELGLPKYHEQMVALAESKGFSRRRLRMVVMDESMPTLQPRTIQFPEGCGLEFAHCGHLIGQVTSFRLVPPDRREDCMVMGAHIPDVAVGTCVLAEAALFDSLLADKVWRGIAHGVLTHACAVVFRPESGPEQLLEVSLVTDDGPGCPGARILQMWELP